MFVEIEALKVWTEEIVVWCAREFTVAVDDVFVFFSENGRQPIAGQVDEAVLGVEYLKNAAVARSDGEVYFAAVLAVKFVARSSSVHTS